MASATETTRPELFARKASGLIREFGFFDSFVFNVIAYSVGLVAALTPFFAGAVFPGANIYLILVVGAVLTIFNGLTYGMLAGTMPRSGGEYVYNGRVLHPALGFVSNWGFTWSQFVGMAYTAQWTINYGLAIAAITLGYGLGSEGLVNLGLFMYQPWPSFILGTLVLVAVVFINLAGMRFLRRFLNLFFIVAMVGTLVTLFVFLGTSRAEFTSIFNNFMSSTAGLEDAYNSVIQLARDNGWQPAAPSLLQVLLALPLGYWVFIGFTYTVYIGGEIKEPHKNQSNSMLASLAFGFVAYLALFAAYYATVGTQFNNAAAYLEYFTDASPLPVVGVLNFFAGILTRNPILLILMAVSFFLWQFTVLIPMFTVSVRNVFAWGIDQVMPAWLTRVSDKTRVPTTASIVVAVLTWIMLALTVFTPIFEFMFNYITIFSIAFWMTSFAAILLPYRRRDVFESAPPGIRTKVFGIPLITISGVINLLLFTLVLYSSFKLPAFSGPVGPLAIGFVLAIYVVGLIAYFIAARVRKEQGVDFELLYGEIPPE
jgi:amino acid transporter